MPSCTSDASGIHCPNSGIPYYDGQFITVPGVQDRGAHTVLGRSGPSKKTQRSVKIFLKE